MYILRSHLAIPKIGLAVCLFIFIFGYYGDTINTLFFSLGTQDTDWIDVTKKTKSCHGLNHIISII